MHVFSQSIVKSAPQDVLLVPPRDIKSDPKEIMNWNRQSQCLNHCFQSPRPVCYNFILYLFVCFWRQKVDMPTPIAQEAIDHLASFFFCQVQRRFHSWELNRQPLPWDEGISPPSSSTLGLSRTSVFVLWTTLQSKYRITLERQMSPKF